LLGFGVVWPGLVWDRNCRVKSGGNVLRGEAPSVVLAVDLRQAAEKEVGEIGWGGPMWRNAVLDDDSGDQRNAAINYKLFTRPQLRRVQDGYLVKVRRIDAKLDARELWHRRVVMRLDGAEVRPKGNVTRADIALLVRADVFSDYEQAS
jgi:hypothetical protein